MIRAGIGQADEVPDEFGVMQFDCSSLDVLRPAPRRAMRLGVAVWIALARANADDGEQLGEGQQWLRDADRTADEASCP